MKIVGRTPIQVVYHMFDNPDRDEFSIIHRNYATVIPERGDLVTCDNTTYTVVELSLDAVQEIINVKLIKQV